MGSGFRVQGSGLRFQGSRLRRVQVSEFLFGVWGSGFRIQVLRFKDWMLLLMVLV